MIQSKAQDKSIRNVRLVVVPSEHGGWVFLFEPLLIGLLVAPSVPGLWLGLAAVAAFLARQPVKLALADRRAGKRYPRTALAERFAIAFAIVALASLMIAIALTDAPIWVPILIAAPIALLQAWFDVQRRGRQLAAELAGALAIGASVSVITLAGGFSLAVSLGLWAVLGMAAVASIMYVRARLRLERGESIDRWPVLVAHLFTLVSTCLLAYMDLVPWLAVSVPTMLSARALWCLRPWSLTHRRPVRAMVIGIQEMVISLMVVVLLTIAYALPGMG